MSTNFETRNGLFMQEIAASGDVSRYRNALHPKHKHFDSFAGLGAVDLGPGESLELYGPFLTKVVMFSPSAPRFERIFVNMDGVQYEYPYDTHGMEYFQGSKAGCTEWVAVNETWSGGKYPAPVSDAFLDSLGPVLPTQMFKITSTSHTHVVFESVLTQQRLARAAPFSAHLHSFRYSPSNYDPPGPVCSTILELHKLVDAETSITDRIVDTLVWNDSVASAVLYASGERCIVLNERTSKAVRSGYFGRLRADGSIEYSLGVLNARMFENAAVHVMKK